MTPQQESAMRQALDDLKGIHPGNMTPMAEEYWNKAITALTAALEQPAQQEPVALPCCGYTDASTVKWNPHNGVVQCHNCGQTYTLPQAREWDEYLKEGETPFERFMRERKDLDALMTLYQRVVTENEKLKAQQEPVPSIIKMLGHCPECGAKEHHFTRPQAREPLTDERITHLWAHIPEPSLRKALTVFARAIEAAHGIGEKK